ncbi:MAG: ATP-binding protein [Burkholderiales bacterium]
MDSPRRELERVQALLDEDLAGTYEDAPAGYLSTLPDGTIVKVNGTFLRWTGFARDALVHKRRLQDLFSMPGRIYYETHLGPLLAMQGTVSEIAMDLAGADGRVLPVMLNAAERKGAEGEPLLLRFTVFNATERRRYERELLQARRDAEALARAKTELLAMLSHDIRTPLGSVMAVAHLLERTELTAEQAKLVRILGSASAAMLDLVNEVLEHSRLEAGAVALNRTPFDLAARARELAANLQPLAAEKDLALECRFDPRLPARLIGDATKLAQVLGNLLGNALKFTEAGSVTLEMEVADLSETEAKLRVRVTDTGIGIEPAQLPHIFDEYTQANEAIAGRYGGTGLGLAISRKLLRAHGSELHAESEPGKGSVFSFDLALELPQPAEGSSRLR